MVKATYITEIATGTQSVAATFMGRMRPIGEITGSMNPELGSLLATYREGLSSITPLYQALSYYKVIEGIRTSHTKRTREAKRTRSELPANPLDGTLPKVAEEVPNVYALETELVAQYGGQTFGKVADSFKDTIRDAIAHLAPGADIRVADRWDDLDKCREAFPLLRYVARRMLEDEIAQADTARP